MYELYLLECADGSYYCGITKKGVENRLKQHNSGKGAKYIRGKRIPAKVLITAGPFDWGTALVFERQCKNLPKDKKINYIKGLNI